MLTWSQSFHDIYVASKQWSNRFRAETTISLHYDVILDPDCIAGHILLSPQRLKQNNYLKKIVGWFNAPSYPQLCCHGKVTSHGRVTYCSSQHDVAVLSCLTYRMDEKARRDAYSAPTGELVWDTFHWRNESRFGLWGAQVSCRRPDRAAAQAVPTDNTSSWGRWRCCELPRTWLGQVEQARSRGWVRTQELLVKPLLEGTVCHCVHKFRLQTQTEN